MSDYLLDEVVLEILYRLPVKSLIRFKHCLDKPYVKHYKLIDDNNDSFHQIQNIELPLIVVSYLLPKIHKQTHFVFQLHHSTNSFALIANALLIYNRSLKFSSNQLSL